jgi:hypothetical protein
MADQVEVSKLFGSVVTGPPANHISVSKLVMFVVAVPGNSPDAPPSGQGRVRTRIITRASRG